MGTAIPAREGRVFAFTLAAGFVVVSLVLAVKDRGAAATVAAVAAMAAVFAGALLPTRLGAPRAAWMAVGEAIGRVTTPILLAVIYFGVVSPLAVLRSLVKRRQGRAESYWHERPPPDASARMERQF